VLGFLDDESAGCPLCDHGRKRRAPYTLSRIVYANNIENQ
jgi:hypothetical protein